MKYCIKKEGDIEDEVGNPNNLEKTVKKQKDLSTSNLWNILRTPKQ
jgi:hypothetical protein